MIRAEEHYRVETIAAYLPQPTLDELHRYSNNQYIYGVKEIKTQMFEADQQEALINLQHHQTTFYAALEQCLSPPSGQE